MFAWISLGSSLFLPGEADPRRLLHRWWWLLETEPTNLGWGPIAAGLLLVANVAVPLVAGDLYPFTSAPMFRDRPEKCANYRVFDPAGKLLSERDWLCQRIYDGNPLGYGVGIVPPPVIEQEFGQVASEVEVRAHFGRTLAEPRHAGLAYVVVEQDIIGPVDGQRVGIMKTERWKIERLPAATAR
ncbi:MAG: hypothetical protein SFU86_07305 [Pirellulaceae bacterium]|nr:hypothetical protein [Pirellulaceae bacterium]